MKRLILVVMVAGMLALYGVGCGKQGTEQPAGGESTTNQPAQAEHPTEHPSSEHPK